MRKVRTNEEWAIVDQEIAADLRQTEHTVYYLIRHWRVRTFRWLCRPVADLVELYVYIQSSINGWCPDADAGGGPAADAWCRRVQLPGLPAVTAQRWWRDRSSRLADTLASARVPSQPRRRLVFNVVDVGRDLRRRQHHASGRCDATAPAPGERHVEPDAASAPRPFWASPAPAASPAILVYTPVSSGRPRRRRTGALFSDTSPTRRVAQQVHLHRVCAA